MATVVSLASTVTAAKGQIWSDLGGEVVILKLDNAMYYSLDPVGTRIWELIQEPRSVSEIRDTLLQEYAVDRVQCEQELLALLQHLAGEGLIEVEDGPAA